MTAPFTASNGYEVDAFPDYLTVTDDAGKMRLATFIQETTLRAIVEYAATIGITAEPSEEA